MEALKEDGSSLIAQETALNLTSKLLQEQNVLNEERIQDILQQLVPAIIDKI